MGKRKKKKQTHAIHVPPSPAPKRWSLQAVLAAALFVFALALYGPTVSYDFTLDDFSVLVENHQTQGGIAAIPDIFQSTYRYGYPIQGDELYRPLPKAIFAMSWDLFGNDPMPLHLLNVLLYAGIAALLFFVLHSIWLLPIPVALGASALFIAHPIHTEVVASIKSLDELLSFVFFLLAVYGIFRYYNTRKNYWWIAAAIAFAAALLSKESAITYLILFPLSLFFFRKTTPGEALRASAWLLLPAILFLIVRSQVVGYTGPPHMADNLLFQTDNEWLRKTTAIAYFGRYVGLLFFPVGLSMDYSYAHLTLTPWNDVSFWVGVLLILFMLGIAAKYFRARNLISFGILFFLVTMSLPSNVIMPIGTHFAERLLFVPSLGWSLAMVGTFHELWKGNPGASLAASKGFSLRYTVYYGVLGMAVAIGSVLTWLRIPVWKDNLSLFESGIRSAPNSFRTHYYLGLFLVKKENLQHYAEAEQHEVAQRGVQELHKAIQILPEFTDAWLHLGNYYYGIKQLDSAQWYFAKCIELDPKLAVPHNNLGTIYFDRKQYEHARQQFERAIRLDPNYHDAVRNMGSLLGTLGQYREALAYFERAIQLAPQNADSHYFLGITYQMLGEAERAQHYLQQAENLRQRTSRPVKTLPSN